MACTPPSPTGQEESSLGWCQVPKLVFLLLRLFLSSRVILSLDYFVQGSQGPPKQAEKDHDPKKAVLTPVRESSDVIVEIPLSSENLSEVQIYRTLKFTWM